MEEGKIQAIGEQIRGWSEVREAKYIAASEAWESFKNEYFEGMEELADGFEADNPLANSASYEIYLKDISNQDMVCLLYTSFSQIQTRSRILITIL